MLIAAATLDRKPAGMSIITNAPDEANQNTTWVVEGRTTAANTLFAWANCLDA